MRLDKYLFENGFFESRARAQAAIAAGCVSVNGGAEPRPDKKIGPADRITVTAGSCPYVSRAGLKLKAGLTEFNLSPHGKICLDVGAATGGFTDCMLKEGAAGVYAIDVGAGQLHPSLKAHPLVHFMPGTNARSLDPARFPARPQLCGIDVSFISLKLVLGPVIECLAPGADIIALIKPQFELSRAQLVRGIVKDEKLHAGVILSLRRFLKKTRPEVKDYATAVSPVTGAHGNTEFLWHLKAAV
ncbi:MAG: TlyA family RNA methyltransferase [Elusimicrobiaceae bacterium]|nr:TlyA family RNA methyltransferase [Elusimicrobiaceae bacterium]